MHLRALIYSHPLLDLAILLAASYDTPYTVPEDLPAVQASVRRLVRAGLLERDPQNRNRVRASENGTTFRWRIQNWIRIVKRG